MKKNVFGRKLKRDKNERKALFKSLMSSLILNERIKTSEAKAKAIKPEIEKLVTKAKKGENAARNILSKNLSKEAVEKLIKDLAPRFDKRQGGYTRLIKLGKRLGDDSQIVLMEWTETKIVPQEVEETKIKEDKKEEKKNPSSRKASKGK